MKYVYIVENATIVFNVLKKENKTIYRCRILSSLYHKSYRKWSSMKTILSFLVLYFAEYFTKTWWLLDEFSLSPSLD